MEYRPNLQFYAEDYGFLPLNGSSDIPGGLYWVRGGEVQREFVAKGYIQEYGGPLTLKGLLNSTGLEWLKQVPANRLTAEAAAFAAQHGYAPAAATTNLGTGKPAPVLSESPPKSHGSMELAPVLLGLAGAGALAWWLS